jgi:hypothetical protein
MDEKTKQELIKLSDAEREDVFLRIEGSIARIVARIAEKAEKESSVPHAKFLLDFSELIRSEIKPEEPKIARQQKNEKPVKTYEAEFSLAQLILDALAAFDRGESTVS